MRLCAKRAARENRSWSTAEGALGVELSGASGSLRGCRSCAHQLRVETDRRVRRLAEIPEVQALVLGVRVRIGVLDADEKRGRAAELAGEGLDERDGPAAPDADRLFPIAVAQRLARGFESRRLSLGVPPAAIALRGHLDRDTPGRVPLQRRDQLLSHLLRVHVEDGADSQAGPGALADDVAGIPARAGLDGVACQ